MDSNGYATAEELLTENLHLHEELALAQEELDRLRSLLEVAQEENLKAYRAYFEVSEKLKLYEYKDKTPLLRRLTQ